MNLTSSHPPTDPKNKTVAKSEGIWARLTQPHSSILEPERRRRVRVLSSLLLSIILLGVATLIWKQFAEGPIVNVAVSSVTIIVISAAYFFSRSKYYQIGYALTILAVWGSSVSGAIIDRNPQTLYFMIFCTLIGSLFLTPRETILVSVGSAALILLLPIISPIFDFANIINPAFMVIFSGALSTIAATVQFRDFQLISQQSHDLSVFVDELILGREALQLSKTRLSNILENAAEAIIAMDEAQTIILFNQGAEKIFGYQADEVIGQSLEVLLPRRFVEIHRHQVTDFGAESQISRPMEARQEIFGRRKNGSEFPAQVGISTHMENGQVIFTAILFDITDRKQAEEKLSDSEARLQLQIAKMPIGCIVWDTQFRVASWNPAAEKIFGFNEEETLGRRAYDLILDKENLEHVTKIWARLLEGDTTAHSTNENRTKDGHTIQCEWSNTPLINTEGKVIGVLSMVQDITEQINTKEALSASEERYRSLFDRLPVALYRTSPQGWILETNPALVDLLRYPDRETLLATNVNQIFINPEERIKENTILEREGVLHEAQFQLRRYDGNLIWVQDTSRIVKDVDGGKVYYEGSLEDITERKRAEQLIRRWMADLEVLYENSLTISRLQEPKEIGQQIIEVLSRKLEWDHAAVRLFHRDNGTVELLALNRPLTPPDELLAEANRLEGIINLPGQGLSGWVIQNGETVRSGDVLHDPRYIETFPDIRSGLYVPIKAGEVTIGCLDIESVTPDSFDEYDERLLTTIAAQAAIALENARLFLSAQQELGERQSAESALRKLNSELEQRVQKRTTELSSANDELLRASRLKDEFLASMSHELRTPLTGILNLSEALQEQVYGPQNEKQLKSLHIIEDSGRHLLGLINDILDLSKIEAGQLKLEIETCQVGEICQSSMQIVKGMIHRKHQNLAFSLHTTPFDFRADPRRIKQILVNLLSNAVKFTPEGGQIGLEVEADMGMQVVRFVVWDTGIGIANEDIPRLFQPFIQLDSSLSRQQSGTGLGLALVQRMTELHDGSVHVESSPGQGSRFTVILPWHQSESNNTVGEEKISANSSLHRKGVTADTTQNSIGPVNEGPSVMVVDDNAINAATYADYLQVKNYKVITATSGSEALELVVNHPPDLILMDIQMPEVNGLEVIYHIRTSTNPRVARIPIIALTALAMVGDRERCMEAGANAYLSKPVSLRDLVHNIDMLIVSTQKASSIIDPTPTRPVNTKQFPSNAPEKNEKSGFS